MMDQRGATIVESMVCMSLLCLVLFGLLQVFQWTMAKMICEYSAFYAAKARAYGFADTIVNNAARVAAIAASGRDTGALKEPLQHDYRGAGGSIDLISYRRELARRAQNYMTNSDSSINYEYWENAQLSENARLYIPVINNTLPIITATVSVLNMPLLNPGVSMFVNGVKAVDIPAGTSEMYNHSLNYLDR